MNQGRYLMFGINNGSDVSYFLFYENDKCMIFEPEIVKPRFLSDYPNDLSEFNKLSFRLHMLYRSHPDGFFIDREDWETFRAIENMSGLIDPINWCNVGHS